MSLLIKKYGCSNRRCEWVGADEQLLVAEHPFDDGEKLYFCPGCKDIGTIELICDEPGCVEFVTCGMPTKDGYRQTCRNHRPEIEE